MIGICHPTGNTFVRALLERCAREALDYTFFTTLAWDSAAGWNRLLPGSARQQLARRSFAVPRKRCRQRPLRELGRLLRQRFGWRRWGMREAGWFSVDAVYRDFDEAVGRWLPGWVGSGSGGVVHAYEDGAAAIFGVARELGLRCSYELPIAYWETSRRLLQEEAARWPDWEPTLGATRDSAAKLERKTQELAQADLVVCPSRFVLESLPESIRRTKSCIVTPFGAPHPAVAGLGSAEAADGGRERGGRAARPLRVLFAGSMTQRKGLADVLAAMRLLRRPDVELVILGTLLQPLSFYRRQFPGFRYEPPRPHAAVLELMRGCDVLVLPSIVEGRALVQLEALSCGLPLVVTANAGGEDLVEPGRNGFLVPIRSPEAIAERLAWLADHRAALEPMRVHARAKAAECTWSGYAGAILRAWSVGRGSAEAPFTEMAAA